MLALIAWLLLTTTSAAWTQEFPSHIASSPLPKTAAELAKRFTPPQIDILEMSTGAIASTCSGSDPPVPGLIVPVDMERRSADLQSVSRVVARRRGAREGDRRAPADAGVRGVRERTAGPLGAGQHRPKGDADARRAFNLTWRARSRRSTDNQDWLLEWYFNFVNARGISFHLFDLPGYPASHACVRLLLRDAQWLYGWGGAVEAGRDAARRDTPGTPVLILGTYPFGCPPPWLSLDALSSPIVLPARAPALRRTGAGGCLSQRLRQVAIDQPVRIAGALRSRQRLLRDLVGIPIVRRGLFQHRGGLG